MKLNRRDQKKNTSIKPAPILLFTHRRYMTLKKTVKSLKENRSYKDHELYIFSDGPRNFSEKAHVKKVRNYLKNISGFKRKKYIIEKKILVLQKILLLVFLK